MNYKELKKLFDEADGSLFTNEDGDMAWLSEGDSGGVKFMKVETYQKNGYTRVNIYYEDGYYEELYSHD